MTPMQAIRAKCIDCCCGQVYEVRLCTAQDCPLYAFRMGKNPNINRTYTEEQKKALTERLSQKTGGKIGKTED